MKIGEYWSNFLTHSRSEAWLFWMGQLLVESHSLWMDEWQLSWQRRGYAVVVCLSPLSLPPWSVGLKKLLHIPCGWQVWDHRTNSFIHTYIFRTVNAGVLADLPTKIFQMSDLNPKMFWGGHIPKPLNLLAQKCVAKIIKMMSGIAYKMSGKSATCVTMSENEWHTTVQAKNE